MAVRKRSSRMMRFAVVALSLSVLPACQGGGFFQRRQALRPAAPQQAAPVVPYSAYRPAYAPGPPKRTLMLGGYAGYNYAPFRVQQYVPTVFGVESWGYPEGHGAKGQGFWHR